MRDWSERHIRELIKDEYKRLGGGGNLEEMLENVRYLLNSCDVDAYYPPGSTIRIDAHFHVDDDNTTVDYFSPQVLTAAQEEQVRTALGAEVLNDYKEYLSRSTYFKAHVEGYFEHRFLSPSYPEVEDFYYILNRSISDREVIYQPKVIREFRSACLKLTDVLPMQRVNDLRNYIYILQDANHTNRNIIFEERSGIPLGNDAIKPSWENGISYRDYSTGRMEFAYDTFLYDQSAYVVYKEVANLLGF
jgi:hypothetical protein